MQVYGQKVNSYQHIVVLPVQLYFQDGNNNISRVSTTTLYCIISMDYWLGCVQFFQIVVIFHQSFNEMMQYFQHIENAQTGMPHPSPVYQLPPNILQCTQILPTLNHASGSDGLDSNC